MEPSEKPKGRRYNIGQCKNCGSNLLRLNKARHSRSKKHTDALYLLHAMYLIGEVKVEENCQTCNDECNRNDNA